MNIQGGIAPRGLLGRCTFKTYDEPGPAKLWHVPTELGVVCKKPLTRRPIVPIQTVDPDQTPLKVWRLT